jgi:hypothetical protein
MLELAAAAFGKVAARRRLAMRSGLDLAGLSDPVAGRGHWNETTAFRHAVAARGEAHHCL